MAAEVFHLDYQGFPLMVLPSSVRPERQPWRGRVRYPSTPPFTITRIVNRRDRMSIVFGDIRIPSANVRAFVRMTANVKGIRENSECQGIREISPAIVFQGAETPRYYSLK